MTRHACCTPRPHHHHHHIHIHIHIHHHHHTPTTTITPPPPPQSFRKFLTFLLLLPPVEEFSAPVFAQVHQEQISVREMTANISEFPVVHEQAIVGLRPERLVHASGSSVVGCTAARSQRNSRLRSSVFPPEPRLGGEGKGGGGAGEERGGAGEEAGGTGGDTLDEAAS